ncbi:MAG: glycoside hydrolase family 92 protein [Candidatus Nealsonbacteria bacterium]|nr:glycoside hydrolase family 92 protein [Candidatus Nealsonbacteria bacterium]
MNESAARTLEYAYDDWCLAQMATRDEATPATSDTRSRRPFPAA